MLAGLLLLIMGILARSDDESTLPAAFVYCSIDRQGVKLLRAGSSPLYHDRSFKSFV